MNSKIQIGWKKWKSFLGLPLLNYFGQKLRKSCINLETNTYQKSQKTGSPHWSCRGSIPLDKKTRVALKEKEKFYRNWVKSTTEFEKSVNRVQFTRARNKVKSLIRSAKRMYEKQIAKKSKLNPKPFWAYTKRKLKTTSGVNPLLENVNDPASLKFQAIDKARIYFKNSLQVYLPSSPLEICRL